MHKLFYILILCTSTSLSQVWESIYPDFPTNDYSSAIHWNKDTLFAAGTNGMFIRSIDAGKTWIDVFTRDIGYDFVKAESNRNRIYLLPGASSGSVQYFRDTSSIFIFSYDPHTNDTSRITVPIIYPDNNSRFYHFDISVNDDCIVVLQQTNSSDPLTLTVSDDEGMTWRTITMSDSLQVNYAYGNIYFNDNNKGVLINPKINSDYVPFVTTDGGASWTQVPGVSYWGQNYYRTINKLPAQWLNDTTFIVINYSSVPTITSNSGQTWTEMSALPCIIKYIHFLPSGIGYVICEREEIYKSMDWGKNWIKIYNGISHMGILPVTGLAVDDSTFLLLSHHGYCIRTSDGGITWDNIYYNDIYQLASIQFVTPLIGVVAATNLINNADGLYCTYDGGIHWTLRAPFDQRYKALFVSNDLAYRFNVYASKDSSLIYTSNDGGASWIPAYTHSISDTTQLSTDVYGQWNHGDDIMFVYTNMGLLRTCDRGKSWQMLSNVLKVSKNSELQSMNMKYAQYKWLLFKDKLLRSGDDGNSWEAMLSMPDSLDPYNGFISLNVLSENTVCVTAETKYIPPPIYGRFPILLKSTDAGVSWMSNGISAAGDRKQSIFKSGKGFSRGSGYGLPDKSENQYIVTKNEWKTNDISLSKRYSGTVNLLNDYFFIDENTGWICGYNCVLRTTNGGIDWIKTTIPEHSTIALSQNYPNPTNGNTNIEFQIPLVGTQHVVSLRIYDIFGREVTTLANGFYDAGTYTKSFNTTLLPPNVYFYRLTIGNTVITRKMLVVK